ncbi:MAG: shikimate dehydrogenase [Bacteroidales bacterium]|nr:shikimate dehydrogenase [Bacteroidales bacterium]
MRTYGIIGNPLSHSRSKTYFEKKFREENLEDCRYENYPLHDISELPGLISRESTLRGINVTIPYKESVLRYINRPDPVASEIGAANVLKINRDGGKVFIEGYNTDMPAFRDTLQPMLKRDHQRALVLGSGGASRAVVFALKALGIDYSIVSRSPQPNQLSYAMLNYEVIQSHPVIINATPVGMFPDTARFPEIPYDAITGDHLLYDLVYNPQETIFLRKGATRGAMVKNGLEMLNRQAEMGWEIWNYFF